MSSIEASSVDDAAAAAAALAEPLERHGIDKLLESIGDCQFVLLGEATHGSAEFYQRRAEITRRLIEEKGFSIIMVEGDWPCAHRVARYISCEPDSSTDRSAAEALSSFDHFPGWMWNNEPTAELVSWLKQHNDGVRSERADESAARAAYDEMLAAGAMPEQMRAAGIDVECHDRPTGASDRPVVAFYGMDVYSVHASAKAVLAFLDLVDPDAAERARGHYAVLEAYGDDIKTYAREAVLGDLAPMTDDIQAGFLAVLAELQRNNRESYPLMVGAAEMLDAEQNAQVVVNGDAYFRGLYTDGSVATWNLRDQHMVQTCLRLVEFHTATGGGAPPPRVVMWAHNSHVGDARATEMGVRDEWNLGQMMRTTFGTNHVFICGFGTYTGTVTAATEWGEPPQTFDLSPAEPSSHSHVFHEALPALRQRLAQPRLDAFLLVLRTTDDPTVDGERQPKIAASFGGARRQRAVGVRYCKDTESRSHYYEASLTAQVDAWIHIDETSALVPL